MLRAFLGGLSLASILFAAPWVALSAALVLAVRYRAWEILCFGAFMDMLYTPPGGIMGIPIPATLLAFVTLIVFEPFRRMLIF